MPTSRDTQDDLAWFSPADGAAHYSAALALAGNRVDDAEGLRTCWQGSPDLVVGCLLDSIVVGICFGSRRDSDPDGVTPRGIGVLWEHAGRGIGGRLLERFETAVIAAGRNQIGVGSAHGFVERFYLSHGYQQVEYMVTMPPGAPLAARDGLTPLRPRTIDGCVVFNLPAAGYSPETSRELQQSLEAADINCIFQKNLNNAQGSGAGTRISTIDRRKSA